jgi:hypothetical protein
MFLNRSGVVAVAFTGLFTFPASAVVINSSWLTATSGAWNDAANWDSVNFPHNGADTYNVTIDATGTAYTVTLNSAVTIDSLTLDSANANVSHTTNTMTVLGNADLLAGSYTLSGGTISGGTWNQNGGLLLFAVNNANTISDGATVTGDLELNNSSGRVIFQNGATFTDDVNFNGNNAYLVINETTALNNKTINMSGSGSQFGIGGSNTLTLGAGMLVHGRGTVGESALVGGTAQLNNQSTIRANLSGQTLSITPNVLVNEAAGLIEADNSSFLNFGSTTISDTSTNLGDINAINGSTVRLRGNWNNTAGTVTVDVSSTLEIEGDFTTSDIGTIDNSAGGDVLLKSNWDNTGDSFTFDAVSGPWTMSGATITGGTINQAGSGEGLRFAVNNSNTFAGGLSYVGDLNFDSGSGRLILESGASFTGDANLNANSTILVFNHTTAIDNKTVNLDGSSATLAVAGGNTLTLAANALVRGRGGVSSGSIVGGTGQLDNNGTIRADLSGQTLTLDPDILNNSVGGLIEATNGSFLNLGSTGAGDTTTNTGDINALGGSTVRMRGDWSNTAGTITVDATSDLELEGVFTTADLGNIDSSAGGSVFLEGNWDNTADSFTFDATTGSWTLNGATITGGTLTAGGGGERLRFGVNNSNTLTGGLNYVGDLDFDLASGRVRIEGGATFTGDVNFNTNSTLLIFNDTQTLDAKTVNMDSLGATFSVSGTNTLTLGPAMLVRGRGSLTSGSIVSGTGQLDNNGTIRADLSGQSLTIDPDVLINSATGVIEATNNATLNLGSTSAGDTTTNAGDINALGGSTVRMRGDWSNTAGTITVDATSDLELEGVFTTADLGNIDSSAGGSVFLEGNWDNTADSFTFDATTGSWTLNGATITGGTLTAGGGGERLRFGVNNSNTLTGGLNYVGDLDFDLASGRVRIEGGATFTGDVNFNTNSTLLIFNDTQTLDAKTVNMDSLGATFSVSGTNTLTLGPAMLVRGRGSLTSGSIVSGTGQLDNNGTIRADLSGQSLTIDPDVLINSATIEALGGGNIRVNPSTLTNLTGTMLTGGTWRIAGGGLFDFDAGSIETNGAEIILDGVGSQFTVIANTPIEDVLTTNASAGVLRVIGNRSYPGTTAFTNAGNLEIGGGTFNTTSFDNQATGEIFGFGTITPQVNTAGTVRASGGRLVLVGGLQGTGSTVVIEAGAILDFDGSDFIDTAATFSLTDGRLEGPGTIDIGTDLNQSGGTFAPGGSVGTTQLAGDYNITGGTQETEFGGAGNPTDLLVATGDINIGAVGTLLDFRPVQGMAAGTYTLMQTTGGTVNGTFASVTDLGIYDDLVGVQYTATTVTFTLDRDLIFGDLNFDGFVGIADLNIVLGNWNQNIEANLWGAGDPTGDGFVGIADLNAVLGSWNLGTPPTVAEALAMVPEPTTGILLLCGGAAAFLRR